MFRYSKSFKNIMSLYETTLEAFNTKNYETLCKMLQDPNLDVNTFDDINSNVMRCFGIQDHEILKLLLKHPKIELNFIINLHVTMLDLVCQNGTPEVTRLFLSDPRIKPESKAKLFFFALGLLFPSLNLTPNYTAIQYIIANDNFPEFNTDKPMAKLVQNHINGIKHEDKSIDLIAKYIEDPYGTRFLVRTKLNQKLLSAFLYALVILTNDEYLELKSKSQEIIKFFKITSKLPIEMIMVLCNRTMGLSNDIIVSSLLEECLKYLIYKYE